MRATLSHLATRELGRRGPGFSIRNGDWLAVDGLGILLLGAPAASRMTAVVVRGEVGLGGSSAGIGLATNVFAGSDYTLPCTWKMDEFLGGGILSLEGRVERMYGPTTWRSTTYVGWQVSFAGIIFKPAVGCMVAADNPRDRHCQSQPARAGNGQRPSLGIGPERRRRQTRLVEQVAFGHVGPAVADGDGLRTSLLVTTTVLPRISARAG